MPLDHDGEKKSGWAGRHHHAEWKLEEMDARHQRVQRKLAELEAAYLRGGMDPLAYQADREKLLEQLE